jgi:4-hydroxy-3-methylbut-2-enyl diphosphate reductase
MLDQLVVSQLDTTKKLQKKSTLLIRAHGIPPELECTFRDSGHEIINGTCPKVKTVHKVIKKYRERGYQIVITGDEGHAEVVGLMGYAEDAGHLIQSVDDVARLPDFSKVCLVSQTTFDKLLFERIEKKIRNRFRDAEIVVKKTICSATERRQSETRKLAREADSIIVVGGKHSANTLRLASIARESGVPTQHVETEKEIDWNKIADCATVGITAGASTPNWMIKRVIDYIQFKANTEKKSLSKYGWHFFDTLAHLNIFAALGAATMYYVSCVLQDIKSTTIGAILSFLYLFSMYLWNSLSSIEMTQHHGISRYRFYQEHKRALFILVWFSIVVLCVISYLQNLSVFYLMLFSTIAGSAYHLTIVPTWMKRSFPYQNLKDIPLSRDILVALAWAVVLTFTPHALHATLYASPSILFTFLWIFFLAFLRSVIFDLRDIEGDRIMGRETLITIIGEKRARKAIEYLIMLFGVIVGVYSLTGLFIPKKTIILHSIVFIFQLPVLLYLYIFSRQSRRISSRHSSRFNLLADTQFYLAGLLAWLGKIVVE